MHEYMTRHMVALREFNYADSVLRPGDQFLATPIDAGYLARAGKAKEGEAQRGIVTLAEMQGAFVRPDAPQQEQASAETQSEPVVIDGPVIGDDGDGVSAPDFYEADASDEGVPRRRGRPRKAA